MNRPLLLGITGGSGSGKSWLARRICQELGPETATQIELDWYYRDLSELDPSLAAQTDFDDPDALELELLQKHLAALLEGHPVPTPRYDFSRYSRLPDSVSLPPKPLILIEGIFLLANPEIAKLLDISVFVETPDDIRLLRRIRRDLAERGYTLEQILSMWENHAYPSFQRFVLPQREKASLIWRSEEDTAFVPSFLADLRSRLARNAFQPTPPR